jgi:hypothetical protein
MLTFFLVLLVGLGFELRASSLQNSIVPLQPYLQYIFALVILVMVSQELFARAGLKP